MNYNDWEKRLSANGTVFDYAHRRHKEVVIRDFMHRGLRFCLLVNGKENAGNGGGWFARKKDVFEYADKYL